MRIFTPAVNRQWDRITTLEWDSDPFSPLSSSLSLFIPKAHQLIFQIFLASLFCLEGKWKQMNEWGKTKRKTDLFSCRTFSFFYSLNCNCH